MKCSDDWQLLLVEHHRFHVEEVGTLTAACEREWLFRGMQVGQVTDLVDEPRPRFVHSGRRHLPSSLRLSRGRMKVRTANSPIGSHYSECSWTASFGVKMFGSGAYVTWAEISSR